jgi:hypothetical protein
MKLSYLIASLFIVSSAFSQHSNGASSETYVADATISNTIDDSSIIKGTVIEESTGKPLPGVLVSIVGTKWLRLLMLKEDLALEKWKPANIICNFRYFLFLQK